MRDRETRIAVLDAIFACGLEVAEQLLPLARWEQGKRNSPILHQGEESASCHFVVSGTADVKLLGSEGQYHQIATVEAGEAFGAYPEGAVMTADVLSRGAVEYVALDASALYKLAREQAGLGARLSGIFAGQLRLVMDRFASRVTLSANGRVYDRLLVMCGPDRRIDPVPVVAALAVQAQTTRETASRAISALERRGILARHKDHWEVASPRMLEELVY